MSGHNSMHTTTHKGWTILIAVIIAGLILGGCGGAQQAKVYHIGIVFSRSGFDDIADGFKAKMTELGYVEGENVFYDLQIVDGDRLTAQQISEKFVADKVDLILACGTGGAMAAKKATQGTDIPVIFTYSIIEGSPLVESVREPGGNITGVRNPGPELVSKRVEILREMMPQLKRLYIAYQADYPTSPSTLEALHPAVAAMGIDLVEVQITSVEDISADLDARNKAEDIGIDAILIMPEAISQSAEGWAAIKQFASDHNLPVAGNAFSQAEQGALFSYAATYQDNGTQAALLADKIFKGTPAGAIPVVTPEAQLLLNFTAAKQLGLTVPESILTQAFEIIR